ncbi:NADP-dependent oxidoreductase domain-containing protein [Aspergillus unguis]
MAPQPPSLTLPPLILGGAGFSYQHTSTPSTEQTLSVITRAFDLGVRAIDTSPYYEPSETLLGEALSHPSFSSKYTREDYILITKVGRVSAAKSDYSPEWIRYSVNRSLERLKTGYLDAVFCHDVELVGEEDVLGAIGVLYEYVKEGKIRYIGISGYPIDTLARIAQRSRDMYGRPLDVIQNWAQMTLQNNKLEDSGLDKFKDAGVNWICSSSPLASGLLRDQGVPIAALGDWHPAPEGLRRAANEAARYVASQGEALARLALRYALRRGVECSSTGFRVSTIMGGTSVAEIEENINTAVQVVKREQVLTWDVQESSQDDARLFAEVQRILGEWMDYSF